MSDYEEKTIKSKDIYDGSVLKLRKDRVLLPDENESYREVIEHSGGVTIIAQNEDNKILMVKQYRKAVEKMLLELPAGKLDDGEMPAECAARELWEETGYRPKEVKKLFSFYTSPGYSNEKLHLYLAKDLQFEPGDGLDPGEFIKHALLDPAEIMEKIKNEKIVDGKTIVGLLYYLQNQDDFNEIE
ncbi:MAG: NUDIX hydrolase [Bacillota bacterium]